MIVKSKKDANLLSESFQKIASFDEQGQKHYFVFEDKKRDGVWTVMNYPDGNWSIHGKGENYQDPTEKFLNKEDLHQFIWDNRGAVNQVLRKNAQ